MKVIGDRLFVALVKRVGFPARGVLAGCRDAQLRLLRSGEAVTLFTVARRLGVLDGATAGWFLRWAEQAAAQRPRHARDILWLFEDDEPPFEEQIPDAALSPDSCREPCPFEESDLGPLALQSTFTPVVAADPEDHRTTLLGAPLELTRWRQAPPEDDWDELLTELEGQGLVSAGDADRFSDSSLERRVARRRGRRRPRLLASSATW